PSILSLFQLTDDQRAAVTARNAAVSVTAGAGSGKTRALVGRYLALLEADLPLRSLVAITFTDKAAREMRNRIRELSAIWLAQKESAADRERWAEAFSALDAARIGTIHGLCAAILRAHPVEAGLDPAFTVLDEGLSAVQRNRAVEEGLAWAVADPDAAQLFSLFQEGQLRRLLTDLLEKRLDAEQALTLLPNNPLPERWAAALDQWFTRQLSLPQWTESLAALKGLQAKKENDKLEIARQTVLAQWEEARQAQADRDWDAFFNALIALRGSISVGGAKGNWAADDLSTAREAMRALRDHFDQTLKRLLDKKKPLNWNLDRQAADALPLASRLFQQTQSIYQGYKNSAHALDFDDLEQMTAQLLVGSQAVRARWQREINAVLLVDEFQDTNQRQREIVYALAGFEPAGISNPSIKPKASSLFVVGDSKQSIYRFRGADVTVFRQVQADIQASGGALINFDLTFRAHKALIKLTNALLSSLMPAEDDPARPYDVPFAPLTAFRPKPRAGIRPPYLEFHIGLGENKNAGRQAAAAGLAKHLRELQQSGQIAWQDAALLFRASTAFGVYENALEQAGIPYTTIAGRGFYDRPEIRDLLNALTAIADPSDDLAMAGLLRSPAIGLSDEAIHLLRWNKERERRPFWLALQNLTDGDGLAEDDRARADFARQLIADLHAQAGRVTAAQLLKAFLDATHYRAALRLAPGGERLRRNVDKLLADAHRSELVNVTEFLEYLNILGDVGVRESEAPAEAGGAVQLMTIHKSKGLEFPVVVLADAGYTGGFRSAPFYLDQDLGLLLHLSDDDALPAAFRLAAWYEAEQEAAEERRLLYVAATRAEEKLIISGDAKLSRAKANPGRLLLSGWLAQLAEVIGLSGTQLPETPATAQSIPLEWENGAAACTIHPPVSVSPRAETSDGASSASIPDEIPDLLAPLTVSVSAEVDEKLKDRESDPPPRVWRIAPESQYEVPAWVIGSLTHIALRHWRFPDKSNFADFLYPFALEAGLTDPNSIEIALNRVSKLLKRFQTHPLYAKLSAAERHHEVPYSLTLDGQTRSGIIDLLFRPSSEAAWTIVEFKTDRLPEEADLKKHAREKGYHRQTAAYRQAVAQQTGTTPQVLLVFLNVARSVQILEG
ncbi:MAG TPA: UvrD-helicase domain-containing protein, partial [Chloroflexi bacterium]|nr:UvrD-helicase domain-containing protein [Chloroflexota bacterium]